jgi:hypothetical protein
MLMVLEAPREAARRGVDKYKVVTVARPPLYVTQGCVLQRLHERVLEEVLRVDEMRALSHGALFGKVLGTLQLGHLTLSPFLGIQRVIGRTSKEHPKAQSQRRPQEDGRHSTPLPASAQHA